jgi:large subunit ribosomal protein L24e
MKLYDCSICSGLIYPGHGVTFVRNDCKLFRFCRSKCRAKFSTKRLPTNVAWSARYREITHNTRDYKVRSNTFRKESQISKSHRITPKIMLEAMKKMEVIYRSRCELRRTILKVQRNRETKKNKHCYGK